MGRREESVVSTKQKYVFKFSSERKIKDKNCQRYVGQCLNRVRQNLSG